MQEPKVSTAFGVLFPKPFWALCVKIWEFILENQVLVLKEFSVTLVDTQGQEYVIWSDC